MKSADEIINDYIRDEKRMSFMNGVVTGMLIIGLSIIILLALGVSQ